MHGVVQTVHILSSSVSLQSMSVPLTVHAATSAAAAEVTGALPAHPISQLQIQ